MSATAEPSKPNRLQRLGEFSARHHRAVIAVWIVAAVALVGSAIGIGAKTSNNLTIPGTESTQATDLLDSELPKQANGSVPLVFRSAGGKLTSPQTKEAIQQSLKKVRQLDSVRSAPDPFKHPAQQLSNNKAVAYSPMLLGPGPDQLSAEEADAILAAAAPASERGVEVDLGGYAGEEISQASDRIPEIVGLTAAVVILLLALGTVGAMALPIVTALFAVGCGLSVIGLLGHIFQIPDEAQALGTMIGLGVGIDYSLFILTRFREARAAGLKSDEAAGVAIASAGSAVVFAGCTVVLALTSLILAHIPIVAALGYSAAIVVVIAVAAAMTLIPAMLAALGNRIEAGRIHHPKEGRSSLWARWAGFVARRPWPMMIISTLALLAMAWPLLNLELGQTDDGELGSQTTAKQAFQHLNEGFGPGVSGPLLVAVSLDEPTHPDYGALSKLSSKQSNLERSQKKLQSSISQINAQLAQLPSQQASEQSEMAAGVPAESLPPLPSASELKAQRAQLERQLERVNEGLQEISEQKKAARQPAADPTLQRIRDQMKKTAGVDYVSQPLVSSNDRAAVYSVQSDTAPATQQTKDLVTNLRENVLPRATEGKAQAYVGGQTAAYIDLAQRITEKLPSIIAIVIALSFVLLLVAFRSILIPLTAAVMNLLSVGAAYGVLTLVFQEGVGAGLVGLDHSIEIVSFVPLIMFAILFGLSMDYEVFLLSRIREHYSLEGHPNRQAVIEGLASTGRVITSAAAIMFCVFFAFVLQDNPVVKQFGLGMSVAILVDATIVRCLLVPSVMSVLGRSNWWLPKWLRWLPHIGLDQTPPKAPAKAGAAER